MGEAQLGSNLVAQAKANDSLDQAVGSKYIDSACILESVQTRPNDGLDVWEEGGVKYEPGFLQ